MQPSLFFHKGFIYKQSRFGLISFLISTEYYNNKEATSSSIDLEGWLHSGDICCITEEGHVYIVDRLKELIKYKGLQVCLVNLSFNINSNSLYPLEKICNSHS